MSPGAVRIEEAEFTGTTLDLIERSFGVTLPRAPGYVLTAGGLFEEILYQRANDTRGERCDTAMLFFRLRSTFARLQPGERVTPSTRLRTLTRMSPNRFAKWFARETGLAVPVVALGNIGCLGMVMGLIGGPLLWWLVDASAFAAVGVASFLMMIADRGRYWGEWETVWSLVDAVASKNVGRVDAMGARNRPEDWWNRYAEILALSAVPLPNGARLVDAHRIDRNMVIELV